MAKPGTPLFLERGSYRQRRMMDAVRLLAILGAGLWMIPLLWPSGGVPEEDAMSLSHALLYIFGVWWFLIAVAFLLSRRMSEQPDNAQGL